MSASTCGTQTASSVGVAGLRARQRRRAGRAMAIAAERCDRRVERARVVEARARGVGASERGDGRRHGRGAGGQRGSQVAPRRRRRVSVSARLGGGRGAGEGVDAEQRGRRCAARTSRRRRDAAPPSTAPPGAPPPPAPRLRRALRRGSAARARRSSDANPVAAEPAANRRTRGAHLEAGRRFDRATQHPRRLVAEKGRRRRDRGSRGRRRRRRAAPPPAACRRRIRRATRRAAITRRRLPVPAPSLHRRRLPTVGIGAVRALPVLVLTTD